MSIRLVVQNSVVGEDCIFLNRIDALLQPTLAKNKLFVAAESWLQLQFIQVHSESLGVICALYLLGVNSIALADKNAEIRCHWASVHK